ncbi:MAG TPA: hypothetical protein VKA30_09755 [Actinomycetota bacterium]|nr:hypothetical protein [Actinomycetota bacterium]
MRVEFVRADDESKQVAAAARWTGSAVESETGDPGARELIDRVFRLAPVTVDDPALRSFGTSGEVTLPPGSLRWFIAAARVRGQAEGLKARFVPDGDTGLGWDPAGAYRTFMANTERLGASPSERSDPTRS